MYINKFGFCDTVELCDPDELLVLTITCIINYIFV